MFESNHARYASYGTVAALPGEMIDAVWQIIDDDLQGLFPLANLLTFKLHNNPKLQEQVSHSSSRRLERPVIYEVVGV